MDQNQRQAQAILEKGWIPQERLRMALEHPNRPSYPDLLDFLLHALMLNPAQVMQLRQELAIEADSRPTVPPRPSAPAIPKPAPTEADELLEIEAAYQRAKAKHPLFSPHARVDFKLLEKLGEGGMGVVHRVEDQRLGRNAALKILNCGPDNPRAVKRFLREASITARLSHPNIPPVFEQGQSSVGERYMLMKVIEGQTLGQVLKQHFAADSSSKMSQRALLEAFVKVCEAVAYAHSQGIIHRDLKPANIMIGEFGEVMVMDWGLAKDLYDQTDDIDAPESSADLQALAAKEGLTMAGDLLGTLGYMPPEQVEADTDEQADVFALGAILTEILSGHRSIRGESALNVLSATIKGDIKGPRAFDKTCPKELDALACLALKAKKEERLQSVNNLIADLKAYLAGEELAHYKYGLFKKSQRWVSRHPTLLMAFSLSVLLISSVGYFQQALTKLEAEKKESERNEAIAKKDLELTEEQKRKQEAAEELLRQAIRTLGKDSSLSNALRLFEESLLTGGRTEALLMKVAKALFAASQFEECKRYLSELEQNYEPAYQALYMLHKIEIVEGGNCFKNTEAMKRLVKLESKYKDTNEFTLLARVGQLIEEQRWEKAVTLCDSNPTAKKSADLYFLQSYALLELKQSQKAFETASQAIKLRKNHVEARYIKATILLLANKSLRALKELNIVLSLRPRFPPALFVRAQTHTNLNDLPNALADYTQLLAIQPGDIKALFFRAQLFLKQGQFSQALKDYKELVHLRPKIADYRATLANTKVNLGQLSSALEDCKIALELDSRCYSAREILGRIAMIQRDFPRALKELNKAIELEPKTPDGYLTRGLVKARQGQYNEANLDFDKAILYKPNYPLAFYNRGSSKLQLNDKRGAVDDYLRAIKLDPNNATYLFQCGSIRILIGEIKEGIADLKKVISIDANFTGAYSALARAQLKIGDNKGAALNFEAYLGLNTSEPLAADIRAFILKHLGRPSKY